MLEKVTVRDFALIDHAQLELAEGLAVFSGETGAGKSLIVGALGFLLGGKSDLSLIREGMESCEVEAVFRIDDGSAASEWLRSREFPLEQGEVIIRRGLKNNGRSYSYLQDRPVSRSDLSQFSSLLADIYGQHEHQTLLDPSNQMELLDAYAELGETRAAYGKAYNRWVALAREYKAKAGEAERRKSERDFLAFTVKEIESIKAKPGEDDLLLAEEKILAGHEKLFSFIDEAKSALGAGDGRSIASSMRTAVQALRQASSIDASLKELAERLSSAIIETEDIIEQLSGYSEKVRYNPLRLETVEDRLAELSRLKRKYGPTLENVLERLERDKASLDTLDDWESEKASYLADIAQARDAALKEAENLSSQRRRASQKFSEEIEAILHILGMPHSRFFADVKTRRTPEGKLLLSPSGMDELQFLIAPNIGESPKPLAEIASGGELSRAALAIKAAMSERKVVDTMIFDEIDTGIGGEVAVAVGKYLAETARNCQVLCVTHLATIASRADTHFKIDKALMQGRTVTRAQKLAPKERTAEIARMLAGDSDEDSSLAHAESLLERASRS